MQNNFDIKQKRLISIFSYYRGAYLLPQFQSKSNVINIIKSTTALDVNKAHSYDSMAIAVAHPLTLTFRNFVILSTFAIEWKKTNVILIYKKNDKQIISNCRSASLLHFWLKFLKMFFSTNFLIFFILFALVIHVSTSHLQSPITSCFALTVIYF